MGSRFIDLAVGARFLYGGEVLTKIEHELREGTLQCSNACSDGGRFTLIADDDEVEVLYTPPGES